MVDRADRRPLRPAAADPSDLKAGVACRRPWLLRWRSGRRQTWSSRGCRKSRIVTLSRATCRASLAGDCESGGRERERGAAGRNAHALPMQNAATGRAGCADAPRPRRVFAGRLCSHPLGAHIPEALRCAPAARLCAARSRRSLGLASGPSAGAVRRSEAPSLSTRDAPSYAYRTRPKPQVQLPPWEPDRGRGLGGKRRLWWQRW